ncbi:M4 family metallopeptidase [Janibacter cremeus]|uniref:Neutral metalloproteinase n=1 Tax=Janibacter cremeus TaxID=1285192 RepID=A0A852VR85_9MICO|nr:M4 family metallopeptidase [Janibacter cremeus]NYF98338.1 Zn-dependent metalloprotease [Janibacter cremeus]
MPDDHRPDGLTRSSIHAWDDSSSEALSGITAQRGVRAGIAPEVHDVLDPESAARGYLDDALASPSLPSLTAPEAAGVPTRFTTLGTETVALTGTRTVKFRQALHGIPVYGSFVVVELDEDNELVGIDTTMGQPEDVDPVAAIAPARAVEVARGAPGGYTPLTDVVPRLQFYFDAADERWRLVYLLEDVPVTTRGGAKGDDAPLPEAPHLVDYVIDAHDAAVVAVLPRTPSLTAQAQEQSAVDSYGDQRTFAAQQDGEGLVLRDPEHNVETFDFGFGDPAVDADALPGTIIANPPDWSPGAVSAHANAIQVARFLRTVVLRNNIDGRGGPMTSTINCVVQSASGGPKEWANAFWNGTQMVYGQIRNGEELLSLSANVDVVGHEIFHGVTGSTARLEYRAQSGALNESYSDVFGTIIANLGNEDPRTWDWLIGERLFPNREALRDMADPTRFDQPAHMDDYRDLPVTQNGDWGGVHTNSGIPNKAAYVLLTTEEPDGALALTPHEVSAVYYIALTQRLSRTSQFVDARRASVASARSFLRGRPRDERDRKVAAVEAAFDAVGIA